mmetsp:Transcript_12190/g.22849  ORF Transcript_12190/g.22849 Transcript_12190/m.22849 type:complete len:510 (-) Transcript_12190:131-1660(-)|eukprot:CAMPEP_0176499184 /NCGR_PEP_ID=MMETSP0200_2-20121128/12774_1 /TAXON_ID=947934 /ORGANISM="Chaetoceros sp., Strain GSL56" /LENGTH=509 /DNA_ID=CAMNT_0017897551 /DNA_START=218 /DNA_END=1747 /DNA_ORIENTATION=+
MSSVPQTKKLTFAEMVALGGTVNISSSTVGSFPVDHQAAAVDRESKIAVTKKQTSIHSHTKSETICVAASSNATVSTDGNSTSSFSTQNNTCDSSTSNKNDVPSSVPKPVATPAKNPWNMDLVRKGFETETPNVHEHPTPAESIAMNRVSAVVSQDPTAVSYSGETKTTSAEEKGVGITVTDPSSSQGVEEHKSNECASSSQHKIDTTALSNTEASSQIQSKEKDNRIANERACRSPRSNAPKIQHNKTQPQAKKQFISSRSHRIKPMHSSAKNAVKYSNSSNSSYTRTNSTKNRMNDSNIHSNSSNGKTEKVKNMNINLKSDRKLQDKIRSVKSNKKQDKKKNSTTKRDKVKVFIPNTKDLEAMKSAAVKQIEYFFSVDELVKNIFMRKHMDADGFLPAAIVFNFPSVLSYCVPYYDLLEALNMSKTVEVNFNNECLRLKGGEEQYKKWIFPNPDGTYGCPKWIISNGDDDNDERYQPSCISDHFEEKKDDGTSELTSETKSGMAGIQ